MDAASIDAILDSARAELDAVVSALRPFDPKEAGPMSRQILATEVARACRIDSALAAASPPPPTSGGAETASFSVDATLEALAECHRECASVAADIRVMEDWLEAKHPNAVSGTDEDEDGGAVPSETAGDTSAADGGEGPSAANESSAKTTAAFAVQKRIVQPPDAASMRRWEVLLARADAVAAADASAPGAVLATSAKYQSRVVQTDCFLDPHVVARDAFPSAAAIEPVPDIVDAVASSTIATLAMHGGLAALHTADAAVERTILDEYERAAAGGNGDVVDVMLEALRQFKDGDGIAEEYFSLVAAAAGGSGVDGDVGRNAAKVLRKALQRAEPQVAVVCPVNLRTLTAPGGQSQGVCVLTSHSLQLFSMTEPARTFAQLAQTGASESRGRGSPLIWDSAKVKAAIATWTLTFSVTPQQLRHVSQGFADPLATEKESCGQAQLTTSTFVGGPRALIVGNAAGTVVAFDQTGDEPAGAIELIWLVLGAAWNRKLMEQVAPGFKLPRCWCMRQTPHAPLPIAKGGPLTDVTPRYDINAGRLPPGSFNPQQAGVFLQDHEESTARIANLSGLSYTVVRDILFRDPVARWRSLLQVAASLPTASASSDWLTASNMLAAVVASSDAQSMPFVEILSGPPPVQQQQQQQHHRQPPAAATA